MYDLLHKFDLLVILKKNFFNYLCLAPPSYEECMQRTDSIKEDDESNYVHGANEPFAPRYPVFNFTMPCKNETLFVTKSIIFNTTLSIFFSQTHLKNKEKYKRNIYPGK